MKQGNVDVTLYLGDVAVEKAYLGDEQVYGGQPLPYDAQVEYLESTGEQYIDLGLKPFSSDVVTIKFRATTTQSTGFIGSRFGSTSGKCIIGSGSSGTIFLASLGSAQNLQLASFDQLVHTIVLNNSTGMASIDGGTEVNVGTYSWNNLNYFLFCYNQNGTASLFSSIQVMSVQIGERMKLIPVRVGTTGYMYDEVSGNLFGNSGAGDFVVGNDKIELPAGFTRKQYIQSTGVCRINTGIEGASVWTIDAQSTGVTGATGQKLLSGNDAGAMMYGSDYNHYWGCGASAAEHTSFNITTRKTGVITFQTSSVSGVVDGETFTKSGNYLNRAFTLFSASNDGSPFYGYLWSVVCEKDGAVVFNGIPCVDENNIAGLYDTVSKTFFPSIGTDQFVAGPDYVEPTE